MTPGAAIEVPSLAERIRTNAENGTLTLPPLPELATRLMAILRDEDHAEPRRIAELIEKDPAIAASLLRVANSASFGGLRAVGDLGEAVARLGMRQVSTLVTAVSLKGNFISSDPDRMRLLHLLWDHAVVTGLASKYLTALGDDGDRNEAFLAGLFHDTGKLVVLKGIDQIEKAGTLCTPAVSDELMLLLHAELGHDVLQNWKIAEPICRVALHHHDPEPPPDDLLLIRVQAANVVARKLGAHPNPDPNINLFESRAIERLNIGDLELATLMVDVEDEVNEVRSLF